MSDSSFQTLNYPEMARQIKAWCLESGFSAARITRPELPAAAAERLCAWLDAGRHGEMDYMARHGLLRVRPAELVPGTLSIISVRMNYWPEAAEPAGDVLEDATLAYLSRYALGRDYHKVLRNRLQKLAERIETNYGSCGYRAFTDSAPVAEVGLAAQGGLGWRGKHSLLLTREQGSLFFLGELFTTLPLPPDPVQDAHCGRCTRCIDACPTGAILPGGEVDARRCISYLTIELAGPIPLALRPLIGNRVYGCDDCQLVCPWNRFAATSGEEDFRVRHGLDRVRLVELFAWDEETFRSRMAGSPIYRIGYERWLRNLAVGLGNAPGSVEIVAALTARADHPSALVREHVGWALAEQEQKLAGPAGHDVSCATEQ